ncbi:hypothetical protein J6590_028384 [Homalodisca vitripennis]|nr:hypothetical protein J6590_028384 [Homalodisca vitripennis]
MTVFCHILATVLFTIQIFRVECCSGGPKEGRPRPLAITPIAQPRRTIIYQLTDDQKLDGSELNLSEEQKPTGADPLLRDYKKPDAAELNLSEEQKSTGADPLVADDEKWGAAELNLPEEQKSTGADPLVADDEKWGAAELNLFEEKKSTGADPLLKDYKKLDAEELNLSQEQILRGAYPSGIMEPIPAIIGGQFSEEGQESKLIFYLPDESELERVKSHLTETPETKAPKPYVTEEPYAETELVTDQTNTEYTWKIRPISSEKNCLPPGSRCSENDQCCKWDCAVFQYDHKEKKYYGKCLNPDMFYMYERYLSNQRKRTASYVLLSHSQEN